MLKEAFMEAARRWWFPVLLGVILVGGPVWYYQHHRKHYRNFREVAAGTLYRSGQMSPEGLKKVVHEYGIKTIINLREDDSLDDRNKAQERWEQTFAAQEYVTFVRLKPMPWWAPEGKEPPAMSNVRAFVDILQDPQKYPRPILIHCFAGEHRTGVYVAIYRMEVDRWTREQAVEELMRIGYTNFHKEEDVRTFVMNYVPTWKKGIPSPPSPFPLPPAGTQPRQP
jgi:tyrosine-protein phosphatase SIW14